MLADCHGNTATNSDAPVSRNDKLCLQKSWSPRGKLALLRNRSPVKIATGLCLAKWQMLAKAI